MNKILLQGSVTLAQTFVDNTKRDRDWIKIGENIIRYIYKWFGDENKNEVEYAVSDFLQHNEDFVLMRLNKLNNLNSPLYYLHNFSQCTTYRQLIHIYL